MSHRRTFRISEIFPRFHLWYDRAIAQGAHHQQQLEILWRLLTSGNEEIVNEGKGGQLTQEGGENDVKHLCTCCGRALDESAGESKDNHVHVPIP